MAERSTLSSGLAIRLLGRFEARLNGASLRGLRLREGDRLLAYLVLKEGEAVSYRDIAERFWPAEAQSTLPGGGDFASTRQAVRSLRISLGDAAERLESPARSVLRLNLVGADVDLAAFDLFAAREDADSWRQAVSLYRGPLLDGWDDRWIAPHRERRRKSCQRLLRRLVEQAVADRDTDAAIESMARLLEWALPDDEALCGVFALLRDNGRREEALELYDGCCQCAKRGGAALSPGLLAMVSECRMMRARTSPDPAPEARVPADARQTTADLPRSAAHPLRAACEIERGMLGGALHLGSPYYIERLTDAQFRSAVIHRHSVVLVKGARQTGKTSLLARGLQEARQAGDRIVLTDFQSISAARFSTLDLFCQTLAAGIALQLGADFAPGRDWDSDLDGCLNLELFLQRHALGAPLVWALDEVDRLFGRPFAADVFSLLRSWHNRRALDPGGPWSGLTLAIAYATEAHLFISDLNQSPFNVGTRLRLEDFRLDEVAELNARHGSPITTEPDLLRFYELTGGQPYLCQIGLSHLAMQTMDLDGLDRTADLEDGPFGDHLRRIYAAVVRDSAVRSSVRLLLSGSEPPDVLVRLRAAGLVKADPAAGVEFRCSLYRRYLSKALAE